MPIESKGELQNIQSSYRLNGQNYLQWSQVVKNFLKGKGKLSHLMGTRPAAEDTTFSIWDEEDFHDHVMVVELHENRSEPVLHVPHNR